MYLTLKQSQYTLQRRVHSTGQCAVITAPDTNTLQLKMTNRTTFLGSAAISVYRDHAKVYDIAAANLNIPAAVLYSSSRSFLLFPFSSQSFAIPPFERISAMISSLIGLLV